ncbi:MAG TPA: VOC family protein [Chloroflexota bacterium]|nr:VOC family protein [Chloroflexota bacterium]
MPTLTPFLWFEDQAEDAMNFYLSIFRNARPLGVDRWGPGAPFPEGSVLMARVEIEGQEIQLFNGGPEQKLTPAFSFTVACKDQAEIDYYWDKLTADGGAEVACGWLTDKFGLSWQIVPENIAELLAPPDPATAERRMKAMMGMIKLDIAALNAA